MAKKLEDKPTTPVAEPPKDQNATIYDAYVHGKNCDTIAQEVGLDSLEVLAIIQEVERTKSNKG